MLRVSGAITDEGFSGARVRDTRDKNRYTKQGAEFLASTVRTATGSAPASVPFYNGQPWFLPMVYSWYGLQDHINEWRHG